MMAITLGSPSRAALVLVLVCFDTVIYIPNLPFCQERRGRISRCSQHHEIIQPGGASEESTLAFWQLGLLERYDPELCKPDYPTCTLGFQSCYTDTNRGTFSRVSRVIIGPDSDTETESVLRKAYIATRRTMLCQRTSGEGI